MQSVVYTVSAVITVYLGKTVYFTVSLYTIGNIWWFRAWFSFWPLFEVK